ncbi:MAG TPA: hypothetical protein VMW81_06430, partial [Nitrospinota bacterium]|nr:hypothetical protein [Nitrospinota bacterium]
LWKGRTKSRDKGMPKRKNQSNIYTKYRCILKMPDLSNKEIDEMRKNLVLLAQTICEHVWMKRFY